MLCQRRKQLYINSHIIKKCPITNIWLVIGPLPKAGYATLITRNAEPPPAPSGLSSGRDTIRHR